jgi:alpha-ketoglutaric semialdehyde dehydrogenase
VSASNASASPEAVEPVLIDGQWRRAASVSTFHAEDPAKGAPLPQQFPVSSWEDCDAALTAAAAAADELAELPAEVRAAFLDGFAAAIEARADEICALANRETGLPISPRLKDVELPRTTSQLRQAAAAVREGSWQRATIDAKANIRSYLAPLGPVWVFGPNNFPLAFNSIAGGDFAAAIAAGNPVIAKANTSHPGTSKLLGECAHQAAQAAGLPRGAVQLIYRTSHADGERLVADPRVGATAYTGSRGAGLKLKAAADAVGKPIYLELSSVNPVVFLPGALAERGDQLADELVGSCLMGAGQFCTSPNLIVTIAGDAAEAFVARVKAQFAEKPPGVLLSSGVLKSLAQSLDALQSAGAKLLAGGKPHDGPAYSHQNTLLRVTGAEFLARAERLQTEAFGNATTMVVAANLAEAAQVIDHVEGSLTGCIYSATSGADDDAYRQLARRLRKRVGRLLNDKMPTGVAVSPAMNHGGPFPATGHPGFTAVGIPAAITRFAMLQCYDNVRPNRLPACLQDASPDGAMWRWIDGRWTQGGVGAG